MKKILFITLVFFTVTCTDNDEVTPRKYPRVRTYSVSNISANGAVFSGEITFAATDIIDHGFLWSTNTTLSFQFSEHISLGPKTGKGVFQSTIERSLLPGVKYFLKAYAKSATHTVFGEGVEFESLGSKAPQLMSITPQKATWGDTITLKGKNFSKAFQHFVVRFDSAKAVIKTANDSVFTVIVPDDLQKLNSAITVSLLGNTSSLEGFELTPPLVSFISPPAGKFQDEITIHGRGFNSKHSRVFFGSKQAVVTLRKNDLIQCTVPPGLPPGTIHVKVDPGIESLSVTDDFFSQSPNITAIAPLHGTYGDEVTITGEFFGANAYENIVRFGETEAEITYTSASEIRVKVPYYLMTPAHNVTVTYHQGVDVSDEIFTLVPPTITSISPERISGDELITITGTNFNPWYSHLNRIMFGSEEAWSIESFSESEIQIRAPVNFYSHTINVSAIVAGQTSNSIAATSPWVRIEDPPQNMVDGVNFLYEDFAYMGLGDDGSSGNYTSGMWKFDPENTGWTQLADFPGGPRTRCIFFKLGDKGYVGGGEGMEGPFNDFWEYDLVTDQWVQKNNLPFDVDNSYGAAAFSDNNTAAILVHLNDVWQYDPVDDAWVTTTNFPGASQYAPSGFSKDGEIYVFGGGIYEYNSDMYKYTPASEEWTLMGANPSELNYGGFIFDINGQIYIGDPGYQAKYFWTYDPVSHEFNQIGLYGGDAQFDHLGLSLNGKGYLFSGYQSSNCWKYDPDI